MDTSETKSLLAVLNTIKQDVNTMGTTLDTNSDWSFADSMHFYRNAPYFIEVLEQYNNAVKLFVSLSGKENFLTSVSPPSLFSCPALNQKKQNWIRLDDVRSILTKMKYGCTQGISFLESSLAIVPMNENELRRLKMEFESFSSELPINHQKNCRLAIEEVGIGHKLSASLIAARGYEAARKDCFSDMKEEQIIQELVAQKLILVDRKDVSNSLIKALRTARNYSAHNVNIYPEFSEALSLVGDYITFLRTIKTRMGKTD